MSTQHYPPQPQGYGQPPYQGAPQGYGQPPYPQQQYQPQQYYPGAPYGQQYQTPPPPPPQNWQPNPPHEGGFHHHQPQNSWDPQQVWKEYNGDSNNASTSRDPFGAGAGQPGADGERGLGATVLGGGAGAFLGHETHKGPMATIAGLAIGAIAANAWEHHEKKKKEERRDRREFDDGYRAGESRDLSRGSRRDSRSRGFDDDRYERDSEYQDDYYRPRHHYRDYDDAPREIEDVDRSTYYDDQSTYVEPRRHHHHHRDRDYDDYDDRESYYTDRRSDYYRN